MFTFRPRLQEAAVDNGGGGAGGNGAAQPAEWLKPFGEHAKVFEGIKDPADLATKWGALNTELTTIKADATKAFDWRKVAAGNDAKLAEQLGRITDLGALGKSWFDAQGKIRSGELAKPLAKDAKPEEVAAWRQANGIPAEPKGYLEKLPNGLVIGEDDKPFMDAYAKIFHDNNVSPAGAHALIAAYYDGVAKMNTEATRVDEADRQKAIGELRTVWGNDYDSNMSILDNWLDGMGAEAKELFKDATLGNGTRLFNSPKAVEFLAGVARAQNPLAHLIPGNSEGGMKNLESELASIEALMADQRSKYWKGPEAAGLQQRYLKLTEAKLALKK